MFDWKSLLRSRGIEFVTRGPSVSRGNVAVKCPWCGDDDPSYHLGISLKGDGWGCWRNRAHRGRSRSRLIEALLRCSLEEARQLAGETAIDSKLTDDDLGDIVAKNLGLELISSRSTSIQFPPEFKRMSFCSSGRTPFWTYLWKRGYSEAEADFVVIAYELRYARTGEWAYRLIIPIEGIQGELLTWTGRTLNPKTIPRYKSLASNLSVAPPTDCLLGLPLLWSVPNPRLLVVCEGPFDALRITALGHDLGVYGTCLFGLNVSEKQVFHLLALRRRFDRVGLCLDIDASISNLRLHNSLQITGISKLELVGVKDPGELTTQEGRTVIENWL